MAGTQKINDASRIALNVNAALFRAGMHHRYYGHASRPTPIEIGNFEQQRDRERNGRSEDILLR